LIHRYLYYGCTWLYKKHPKMALSKKKYIFIKFGENE